MSNLLDTLGRKKSAEGSDSKAEPGQQDLTKQNPARDLLGDAAVSKLEPEKKEQSDSNSADSKDSSDDSKRDSSDVTKDDSAWSKESALKEVKKLREENKQVRLKYAEKLDEQKRLAEEAIKQKEIEFQESLKAAKELQKLKEQEEDKKRTLEEKLDHRSSRVAQLETELEARKIAFEKQIDTLKGELSNLQADRDAQEAVYKQRVEDELASVPEKFKSIAKLIVKGAENARDAWVELAEAKSNGLFEEKKIIVDHRTPDANTGARRDQRSFDEINKEQRAKMSSQEKIRTALNEMRTGVKNSAFPKTK